MEARAARCCVGSGGVRAQCPLAAGPAQLPDWPDRGLSWARCGWSPRRGPGLGGRQPLGLGGDGGVAGLPGPLPQGLFQAGRGVGKDGSICFCFSASAGGIPLLLEGLGLPSLGCGPGGCGRCCSLLTSRKRPSPWRRRRRPRSRCDCSGFPVGTMPGTGGGLGSEEVGFRRMAPGPPRALLVLAPGPTQPRLQDRAVSGPG